MADLGAAPLPPLDLSLLGDKHFFFFSFFFRVEVEPINSAVIVSGAGKWDSTIHTHVSILPPGFENQRVLPPSFLFLPSK